MDSEKAGRAPSPQMVRGIRESREARRSQRNSKPDPEPMTITREQRRKYREWYEDRTIEATAFAVYQKETGWL